ncbi:hypothetical protein Gogos_021050 [Gossypium gossypioides]|uniref:Uncharacterized protein n=1 Tax=Gossypium gossypioides TaxID=34282 RepID=A0A7J9CXU9_GOSGO|nr:hypothetical protein [Gossypium gossypioides]
MEKGFLFKVEDNAAVRTRISVTQNRLQELKEIWDQWNNEVRQSFYFNYGDLPYLLDMKVDKHLFRALAQFGILPTVASHTGKLIWCLQ